MADKQILNVTDLSSYLYCPRKFFLTKVKGMKEPLNKAMVEGSIRHKVLEEFGNNEQRLIENLEKINHTFTKESVTEFYEAYLKELIRHVLYKNERMIYAFKINSDELKDKIEMQMNNEIKLRVDSIMNTIKKGFVGKELWENLSPKYLSEYKVLSEKLGLKGRIDRLMIKDIDEIIPFELKTRVSEKIWPSDEVQLTAYAMLLEEEYGRQITKGILESGNIKHEMEITEKEKQKVVELIKEVHEVLENGRAKFPSSFAKCQSCNFEEDCDKLE